MSEKPEPFYVTNFQVSWKEATKKPPNAFQVVEIRVSARKAEVIDTFVRELKSYVYDSEKKAKALSKEVKA